ncbi:hypothetical protein RRG08_012442, partial [Elysia crispata]
MLLPLPPTLTQQFHLIADLFRKQPWPLTLSNSLVHQELLFNPKLYGYRLKNKNKPDRSDLRLLLWKTLLGASHLFEIRVKGFLFEAAMEGDKIEALFAGVEYDIKDLMMTEAIGQRAMQEMKSHLVDKFEALAAKQPKKPFLIYDDMVYTYEAVDDMACRVANIARSWGLKAGDCVAIMIQNEPSFVYTFLGLQKLGISVALINYNLTSRSLVHSVSAVDSKALIVGSGKDLLDAVTDVLPELRKVPVFVQGVSQENLPAGITSIDDLIKDSFPIAFSPSVRSGITLMDTCCFIFTSGTTGDPKPVLISHLKIVTVACMSAGLINHSKDDVIYLVLPLYHSTAMFFALGSTLLE